MSMNAKYDPKEIEAKWQAYWEEHGLFHAKTGSKKRKFYALVEFPYPSGDGLHVGHVRPYVALDSLARKRRMEGYEVLYPFGWDAFGLPTENYAVKHGIHPEVVTKKNTDNFRRQVQNIGISFDWSREINTTDPKYYKWTQWIFLQLFKKGLAYKQKMDINWCPSCKIGLANEEAVGGVCERCGGPTEKREKEQWMLAITKYADRLDRDLDMVDYPDRVKTQQRNWIGKSEGTLVKFRIREQIRQLAEGSGEQGTGSDFIEVFTTRVDTIFSGTFLVLAPEHPLVEKMHSRISNYLEVCEYVKSIKKKSEQDRLDSGNEKTGVELKGIKAINPASGDAMPVWIADFVLAHYGTGAVFADAHDERDFFLAKKYEIPLKVSILPEHAKPEDITRISQLDDCFSGEGILVNSGLFDGLRSADARPKIVNWLEQQGLAREYISYKLRDWVFSRQRYWGEPIPLVFCAECKKRTDNKQRTTDNEGEALNSGWVAVPEEELPLELPKVASYVPTETGESPLAAMEEWVKTTCPVCEGPARRETDTMPNWAGSSWYYLRYTDPKNNQTLASQEALEYWMRLSVRNAPRSNRGAGGVDWYNGGMEHTTLHLLYSRFWHKFLFDIGVVPTAEPYAKRTSHGLILAEGGVKMSKSKGNVVNPDDIVRRFGADTLRVYEMFMGPFEQAVAWSEESIAGARRFLEKVWKLQRTVNKQPTTNNKQTRGNDKRLLRIALHKTIKKVSEDIEAMRFNTAISALMILVNEMEKSESVAREDFEVLLILLSPFAPHMAEELWERAGNTSPILSAVWPEADPKLLKENTVEMVVQINGKLRARLRVAAGLSQEDAESAARAEVLVAKHLDGKEIRKTIFVPDRLVNFVVG